ncbi:hypothetical protein ACTG9Q_13680 [Actinokineospora sp. 24-640]
MSAEALLAIAIVSGIAAMTRARLRTPSADTPFLGAARPQPVSTRPARRHPDGRPRLRPCDRLAQAWGASDPERR